MFGRAIFRSWFMEGGFYSSSVLGSFMSITPIVWLFNSLCRIIYAGDVVTHQLSFFQLLRGYLNQSIYSKKKCPEIKDS